MIAGGGTASSAGAGASSATIGPAGVLGSPLGLDSLEILEYDSDESDEESEHSIDVVEAQSWAQGQRPRSFANDSMAYREKAAAPLMLPSDAPRVAGGRRPSVTPSRSELL